MVPYLVVDAFTDRPFAGNPAAVVFLDSEAEPAWMQQVAAEMRHSETAFVQPEAGGVRPLRWFTPAAEVDLCGHATLASAHALWETGRLDPAREAVFSTRSGELRCRRDGARIAMDFPVLRAERCEPPDGLFHALGLTSSPWVGRGRFDLLVVVDSAAKVELLEPDFAELRRVEARGVAVTAAASGGDVHFVSRFFAPGVGVDEDPVTGSAHTMLAPYWAGRLKRNRMRGRQLSARGGVVDVEVKGERVVLRGQAVSVARGELLV